MHSHNPPQPLIPGTQVYESGTILDEWAVFDDRQRLIGVRTYRTLEAAEEYLAELTGPWQDDRRADAEAEEADDFKNGNSAWYRWTVDTGRDFGGGRDGGYKARTYRIGHRTITPWDVA